jgi:hypothetical protein
LLNSAVHFVHEVPFLSQVLVTDAMVATGLVKKSDWRLLSFVLPAEQLGFFK